MKKKQLIYFVDDTEIPFILKDIIKCSEVFEKIYLFSIDTVDNKSEIPKNVVVFDDFMDWKSFSKKKILTGNWKKILGIYLFEIRKSGKLLPIKSAIARIVSNIFKAEQIQSRLLLNGITISENTILYSFWFYDTIFMAWLKQNNSKALSVARTHSGDLYEDHISIRNQILLRNYQLKYLDALYPVSDMGTLYLQKLYPDYKSKIKTIRLGTEDRGVINPLSDNRVFNIVSVASLRHHKRIHVIAESLLHTNSSINWFHFGNENLHTNDPKIPEYLERKEQLKSKENVTYHTMGLMPNDKILDFYQSTQVNLFISLSEAEGIPVSIMEAISFGIPVLSTDVGGCSEIVNNQTGILIPLNTPASEVGKIIEDFILSDKNSQIYREKVRSYWLANYSETSNYSEFFGELNEIEKLQS